MTGFPQKVLDIVQLRSHGTCEICGMALIEQLHHRRPRAMGGSKAADTNTAANCLGLCTKCHATIESRRDFARDRGWLVRQKVSPADVPVVYQGDWRILTDGGGVFVLPQGSGRCERCGFHVTTQGHRGGCQLVGQGTA